VESIGGNHAAFQGRFGQLVEQRLDGRNLIALFLDGLLGDG
jgi:hypothetical protein